MLRSLSAAEITEWMAYYNLERDDQIKAKLEAEAKANANRSPSR